MRLYLAVATATARRMATYRSATVAGIFTNTVFGFILAYVLVAVFAEKPTIGTFDVTAAVTFTFVTQGMLMVVGIFGNSEQANLISSGDVAVEFSRPYDYQAWWLAVWAGRAGYYAIFRGVPPFLVGALVFPMRLPDDLATWAAFVISVALASAVAFAYGFIISCLAFWIIDIRGPAQIMWFTAQWLAGVFVPLVLFPEPILRVVRLLPFAAMVQLPVEIFLNIPDGAGIVSIWTRQVLWFVVLLAVGRAVLAAATRRVVIQGG